MTHPLKKPRLVMKFGGTSVADVERLKNVSRHILREQKAGYDIVVVVSAMSGVTNTLVGYTEQINKEIDKAEYDAVVSTGEQITSGLLAAILIDQGQPARSFQSWQIPITTDETHTKAHIQSINTDEIGKAFSRGEIIVIPGFQGITPRGRIATLGRGGSDTSAVTIAGFIGAERCDIYTDVDGVYTTDPRIVPKAQRIEKISFEEMLEMASLGAKVLQVRSVESAYRHNIPVYVRSSFDDPSNKTFKGTLVCAEDNIMDKNIVTGITYQKDEAKVTLRAVKDRPGVAAQVFSKLAQAEVNVDMIVQNISPDGKTTDITFTVPKNEFATAMRVLEQEKASLEYHSVEGDEDVVKVSIVGIGMRTHSGVASKMFQAMADKSINIQAITTSEIKISILIESSYAELAVRTLHAIFGLDAKETE